MTKILEIDPLWPQPERIARAAELIRAGEVVGLPTDTVYGLASDAFNGAAAEKVFALKQRSATAPLLMLVNSMEMAMKCAQAPPALFEKLAKRFWPGPLTIVVPAASRIPTQVTAGRGTVGIRFPQAAIALALIAAAGVPITASSANRSGEPECRTAEEVDAAIGVGLKLILDGRASLAAVPSTVVSVVDGGAKVLREGAIAAKAISDFLRI